MTRTFQTTDGRRLKRNPKVPYRQLDYLVDGLSVYTLDGDLADQITERAKANPGWTPRLIAHAIDYALARHAANRAFYRRVMGGL